MKYTKERVKAYYPRAERIEQIGSKQLFLAYYPDRILLISYSTVIGVKLDNIWYITTEKYSQTTSKQTSQFIGELLRSGVPDTSIMLTNDLDYYLNK